MSDSVVRLLGILALLERLSEALCSIVELLWDFFLVPYTWSIAFFELPGFHLAD